MAFFAEVVHIFAVPRSVGQIYGLLYASAEPLSFSDIVERLEISKGSASQGLQWLRSLGAIKVADAKDKAQCSKGSASRFVHGSSPVPLTSHSLAGDGDVSRRIAYEPELGLRRLMSGILQERVAPLAATGVDRLAKLQELAEQDGEDGDFYLDRVRQLETWRRRLKTVLPILSALLGPKNIK